LESLEAAVDSASKLFQAARVEYVDVLLAQRDLRDARMVLIDTKMEQLAAIVSTYQALGGGWQIQYETCPAPHMVGAVTTLPSTDGADAGPQPDRLPEATGPELESPQSLLPMSGEE